jgi:hypothetical protein
MSKELAADYFSRHLSSNECHITSDGRVFHSKGTADGFANGLKDNAVAFYTRAQIEAPAVDELEEEEDVNPDGEKETRFKNRVDHLIALGFERSDDLFFMPSTSATINVADVYEITDEEFEISVKPIVLTPKDETPKVYTLEDLKGFDTATAEYEDIKALAKGLNLESASNSKKDLIAAIENQKVIINTEVKA